MRPGNFLREIDKEKVQQAIAAAEATNSGQIRVMISHKAADPVVAAAERNFIKLGMEKTTERNAILIFLAPRSRKIAVVGDRGIHERCGDDFWREVVQTITGHFQNRLFTEGVVAGIAKAGEILAAHFPPQPGGKNEQSDEIVEE